MRGFRAGWKAGSRKLKCDRRDLVESRLGLSNLHRREQLSQSVARPEAYARKCHLLIRFFGIPKTDPHDTRFLTRQIRPEKRSCVEFWNG